MRLRPLLAIALAAALPMALAAQTPSLALPLGFGARAGTNGPTLAPQLRLEVGALALASTATIVGQGSRLALPDGALAAAVTALSRRALVVRLEGDLRSDAPALHAASRSAALGGSTILSASRVRVEGGARIVRQWGRDRLTAGASGRESSIAAWTQLGATSIGAALRQRSGRFDVESVGTIDSASVSPSSCRAVMQQRSGLPPATRIVCSGVASSLDVALGLRTQRGPLSLDAWAGRRASAAGATARAPGAWGSARLEWATTPSTAIAAELSRQPSDVARGIPSQTRVFAGVRFTPFARRSVRAGEGAGAAVVDRAPVTTLAVRRADDGARVVRVYAPLARSVELTGDMTGWRVVALVREEAPGWWSAALPIAPGTYTCNVRIDGGVWTPPAGLPTVDDGFSGRAGLVVIE